MYDRVEDLPKYCSLCGSVLEISPDGSGARLKCPKWGGFIEWMFRGDKAWAHYSKYLSGEQYKNSALLFPFDPKTGKPRGV